MTMVETILVRPKVTVALWWLDIAPLDSGNQWGVGYYNMDKPRTIKGLTHKSDLMECAVEEVEWLTANNYSLNKDETRVND